MKTFVAWKQKTFPKGIRRELAKVGDRLFRRATEDKLARAFACLEIPPGALICVHSMLSGLGYIVGGPETVIRAIQKAVPGCTIIMPTFPFPGSMLEYIDSDPPPFDIDATPSCSGLLTETLRAMPGAKRSYHPTHPCAALGPRADELLEGSEWSLTPFGDNSAYGRFTMDKDAYLLLIHTNKASILHRIQELVDMPNLFLAGTRKIKGYGPARELREYEIKVYRPEVPSYVAIEGEREDQPQFLWIPDYAIQFPQEIMQKVRAVVRQDRAMTALEARQEQFLAENTMRVSRFNHSELGAVAVAPWLVKMQTDVAASIDRFNESYRIERT